MLVLERKDGQKIFLQTGDGLVELGFRCVASDRVKVSITAPQTVNVLREELYLSKLTEQGET